MAAILKHACHSYALSPEPWPCWSLVPEGLGADGRVHGPELESAVLRPLGPLFVHPLWFEYYLPFALGVMSPGLGPCGDWSALGLGGVLHGFCPGNLDQ